MRCRAYQLPSEEYREVESQILQQLAEGDREQLLYLVEGCDLEVELLSGEWRVLMDAAKDFHTELGLPERRARMAISPEELAAFVAFLREPDRVEHWAPISFGLAELVDALPVDSDLVGLVVMEESDDWLWVERSHEIVALRPEVYELLRPSIDRLTGLGDHAALARLCADHSEGSIELSRERWQLLVRHAHERVPELVTVFNQVIASPADYTSIREGIALLSDPTVQPSLDAWLRVHADAGRYALYFRDLDREIEAEVQQENVG